ncbi:ClpP/crotonase-like domain-containing protein [Xylaria longipes]|nr:ClpP/crotonase-like domain-containing protein [Xylaria longipes]
MKSSTLLSLFAGTFSGVLAVLARAAASAIVTTKVNPSYWRATFSDPPFNLQGTAFYEGLYSLIDEVANDADVTVVVFDSTAPNGISAPPPRAIPRIAAIVSTGLGLLPGGGGLHLLPRLTGRGRTLEIVLGVDDVDADIAALYGWINRAIPDHQFDHFVDKFARRVASWDHYAITMAKKIINGATGFPKVEEVTSDYNAFQATFGQGVVAQRAQALIASGLQTIEKFEINAAEEVLRFAGNGPWDSE